MRPNLVTLAHGVQLAELGQDLLLGSLDDLAADDHLVDDGVDLVEVEDEVEFADIAEVLVEDLDEQLDELEVGELVVGVVW